MKKSNFKKRALIVLSTIIGVIALFLIVVFIPIGSNTDHTVKNDNTSIVAETEETESSGLSKKELEKRVKELEEENKELKDEVEKYKILAEQTTQAIAVPVVKSTSDEDDKNKTSSDDKEYKDSSEYYDKNYKDYTNDDDEDKKTSSSTKKPSTPSKNNSSSEDSKYSDTGL